VKQLSSSFLPLCKLVPLNQTIMNLTPLKLLSAAVIATLMLPVFVAVASEVNVQMAGVKAQGSLSISGVEGTLENGMLYGTATISNNTASSIGGISLEFGLSQKLDGITVQRIALLTQPAPLSLAANQSIQFPFSISSQDTPALRNGTTWLTVSLRDALGTLQAFGSTFLEVQGLSEPALNISIVPGTARLFFNDEEVERFNVAKLSPGHAVRLTTEVRNNMTESAVIVPFLQVWEIGEGFGRRPFEQRSLESLRLRAGETLPVEILPTVPAKAGYYVAYLTFQDEAGTTLTARDSFQFVVGNGTITAIGAVKTSRLSSTLFGKKQATVTVNLLGPTGEANPRKDTSLRINVLTPNGSVYTSGSKDIANLYANMDESLILTLPRGEVPSTVKYQIELLSGSETLSTLESTMALVVDEQQAKHSLLMLVGLIIGLTILLALLVYVALRRRGKGQRTYVPLMLAVGMLGSFHIETLVAQGNCMYSDQNGEIYSK
jgi:hypothetical protein